MSPKLALSYNSQNNETGWFGYGWNMSIPYIDRTTKTGTDKLYTSPAFVSSLHGELVSSNGSSFEQKIDDGSYAKYTFTGTTWQMTDRDGTTYYFGTTYESRVQDDTGEAGRPFCSRAVPSLSEGEMTNQSKNELIPWGADLVEVRERGGDVARVAEEKLLAKYRKMVRAELQGPSRQTAAESFPAVSAAAVLLDRMREAAEPGSEDLLEGAIIEILQELDRLRSRPPSDYLVDDRTGKLVAPLSQESVFRPPSFIGEDGVERQASLTVHPGITSSFALAAQEEARTRELAKKASDPMTALALAHILRPDCDS
jgi:hypothetical protein